MLLLVFACDEGSTSTPRSSEIAIRGSYEDGLDVRHVIAKDEWAQSLEKVVEEVFVEVVFARYAHVTVNNAGRYVVAQNDADNPIHPGLFSRFEWFELDGTLLYCQSVFDAPSAAEAEAAPRAGIIDLSMGRCGESGGPWLELTPLENVISIRGSYEDGFGGRHVITKDEWTQSYAEEGEEVGSSRFTYVIVSNAGRYVVAQNDAENAFNPGLFSRFEWFELDGTLLYCQSVYDAPSAADAEAALRADVTSPTGGCGGFPWSELTPLE